MYTSYEVGAVFKIIDEATPTLTKLADQLKSLDTLAKSVNKLFGSFGKASADGLITSLSEAENKLKSISSVADATSNALKTSFSGADTAITGTIDKTKILAEQLRLAGEASNTIRLPKGGRPRIGGGGSGNGGGGNHSFGGGFGRAGGRAQGMHEQGKNYYGEQIEVGMNMGMLGTIGYAESSAAVKDTLEHAFKLIHVQEQMQQGGISQVDIAKATAAAWKESALSGQDVVKVLEDIKELTYPLGNVDHAIEFAGPLEKMRVVLNAVTEGTGNSSRNAVYEMARAGELKGLQTPEEFNSYFDNMTKVISATGGKVTPKDFMQAMKYGRLATLGWDEEFTTKYLPTLMQSLGPSGAGTAAMSLFGTLVGGTVKAKAAAQMDDLGLIGDASKIKYNKAGDVVGFDPTAIKNTDELVKNPALWVQHTLLPLMETKFGSLDDVANRLHAAENLGGMFGNRMSAQAIGEFLFRMKSIDKDVGLTTKARGIVGADMLLSNDPDSVIAKVSAAMGNLMTSIGGPGGPAAIAALNGLASGINAVTEFFNNHPEAGRLFLIGTTAMAAGFAVLTTVGAIAALAFFLPGGAAFIGLTAIGSLLASTALFHWQDLPAIGDKLGGFFDKLKEIEESALSWLPGMGNAGKFGPEGRGHGAPHPSLTAPENVGPDGAYLSPMAYETGGPSFPEDVVYRGVLRAFTDFANGKTVTDSVGGALGGGGFLDASYTTWGASAAPDGGGIIERIGRGGGGGGGIFGGSGGSGAAYTGSGGSAASGGPGWTSGMRARNLGNIGWFGQHTAGLLGPSNSRDVDHSIGLFATQEDGIRAAANLALHKYNSGRHSTWDIIAAAGGWTPGALGPGASVNVARAMGIGNRDDTGLTNPNNMVKFLHGLAIQEHGQAGRMYSEDMIRGALIHRGGRANDAAAPAAAPPPAVIHNHIHLDGKAITASVVKRMTVASRFPTSMGGVDGRSHYSNAAGTPVMDAA